MASGATISNITSYMTITATASGTVYLGGIVGAIDKVDNITTITNCKNYGVVFADALGNNVGGIVGSVGKGFKIVNCVNLGNITGGANVGGIIGYVANTITSFEVTSCTNSGTRLANKKVSNILYGSSGNNRGGLLVGNYGCKKFTIKFSVNGTITSVSVVAGNVPTFDGAPTKEKDSNYTYTFAGWAISDDGSVIELPVALEDATYYAIFACDTIEEIEYIDLHSSSLTTQQKEQIDALFYKNVVTSKSDQTGELTNPCTADPSVVYCKEDGYYYMYGTYDTAQGTDKWRISCFRSSDFIKWEQLDYAFYGPTSSTSTYESVIKDSGVMTEAEFNNYKSTTWIKYGNLWAPSVFYDETTKQYIMYSSGQTREDGGYALFIATSKNPAGPFIQWKGTIKGGTYQDGTTFATKTIDYATKIFDFRGAKDNFGRIYDDIDAIDAEPFIDPKTGDKYLFFVSARNGTTRPTNDIFGIKMIDWFTPDMSTLTLLAKPNYKKVTDTTPIFNDEGEINEGPCVLYNEKNGYYYLTFTVNGYMDKEYCVKQAIATSPLGVYDKITNDKGGRIISCQNNWTHRAGTGHHTFITVGNELFIVCPMHKVPTYTGSKWRSRVITIERTVWVTNSDGLLVLNSSGPTMDYTLRPDIYTGYTNLVSKATIGYNQAENGANTVYLADGTVKVINKGDIAEFNAKKEQLVLSLGFDECITLKGLMITNSADKYKAFDKISKIEIEYFKNGVICKAVIGEVLFDFEKNLVLDDYLQSYLVPGCNSTAIFNEIQNVRNIKIYIEPQVGDNITGLSVAEIAVIGK